MAEDVRAWRRLSTDDIGIYIPRARLNEIVQTESLLLSRETAIRVATGILELLDAAGLPSPPTHELPAQARLRKAVERYDDHDADTGYYDTREIIDAARALLAAPMPPPATWQPIATIPQEPCLIAWSEQQSEMSFGGRRVEMIGGRQEYEEIVGYGEPPATHWMPLPPPPSSPTRSKRRS